MEKENGGQCPPQMNLFTGRTKGEIQFRIDCNTVDVHFKMKMRASAVAGVAGHGDLGALCNHITNLDEQGAVVRIQGFNAVAVIEDDVVAIAVRPFGYDHLAVVGCIYCGTEVARSTPLCQWSPRYLKPEV